MMNVRSASVLVSEYCFVSKLNVLEFDIVSVCSRNCYLVISVRIRVCSHVFVFESSSTSVLSYHNAIDILSRIVDQI